MIGLFSASGDGEFGRSRSAPKSAPRRVGRLRGPLPLALLAHDLSVNFHQRVLLLMCARCVGVEF